MFSLLYPFLFFMLSYASLILLLFRFQNYYLCLFVSITLFSSKYLVFLLKSCCHISSGWTFHGGRGNISLFVSFINHRLEEGRGILNGRTCVSPYWHIEGIYCIYYARRVMCLNSLIYCRSIMRLFMIVETIPGLFIYYYVNVISRWFCLSVCLSRSSVCLVLCYVVTANSQA